VPNYTQIVPQAEAIGFLPASNKHIRPITVIGTEAIRATMSDDCLQQAVNARMAPGVTAFTLNPDAHLGYGAPVGSVLVSPTHIYPGPVGVDIKCSMSLLQLDLDADAVADTRTRQALIEAIVQRTPTGAGKGQRQAPKARAVSRELGRQAVVEGASAEVLAALGVPQEWAAHCEDAFHLGHDGSREALWERLDRTVDAGATAGRFAEKVGQLGSYGGGNHFGECEVVSVGTSERAKRCAAHFGLRDGGVAFLSHCGSRGFGSWMAQRQFKELGRFFEQWGLPLPGADRNMVYAPLGTPEADAYLDDMALGANFATVNHLLINALVLEAFQEVIPGVKGDLVYFISHNIARRERAERDYAWVHRKGATRAFPAGHPELDGTRFAETGHPILLPGNPQDGSCVMVADPGAAVSNFSVNHGAGRSMSRTAASKSLDQAQVDHSFRQADILFNGDRYPIDEAPGAYKDFNGVLESVTKAGLASEVARLRARFVIKDGTEADD